MPLLGAEVLLATALHSQAAPSCVSVEPALGLHFLQSGTRASERMSLKAQGGSHCLALETLLLYFVHSVSNARLVLGSGTKRSDPC